MADSRKLSSSQQESQGPSGTRRCGHAVNPSMESRSRSQRSAIMASLRTGHDVRVLAFARVVLTRAWRRSLPAVPDGPHFCRREISGKCEMAAIHGVGGGAGSWGEPTAAEHAGV
jgi:hypothetical protein